MSVSRVGLVLMTLVNWYIEGNKTGINVVLGDGEFIAYSMI